MGEIDLDAFTIAHHDGSQVIDLREPQERAGYDAYSVADGTSGWLQSSRPLEEAN